jgi:diguanylate cyclase (GGDEF)-like protein
MGALAKVHPLSQPATSNARVNQLARELSIAALDSDEATARQALGNLLKQSGRRSDEKFQEQLKAIENLFLTLRSMALIDELTTLYNRRGFLRTATRLLETARRDRHGALLFFLDVDDLKSINDSAGHDAGDRILVQTAQVLCNVFRNRDIVSRLGGDEFAVLALSSDPKGGEVITDRLHAAIEASNAASTPPHLSLSVGVVRFDPHSPLSLTALMQMADVAMYGDKMSKLLELPRPIGSQLLTHGSPPLGVGHSSSAQRA